MFHCYANWHLIGSKAGFLVAPIGRTGSPTRCGGGGNGSAPWRCNRSTSQLRSFTDDDHGRDAGIARGSAVVGRPDSSSGCRAKTHRAKVPAVYGSAGSPGGPVHAGGLPLRPPLAPLICIGPDQLLLLGVDRDHRAAPGQRAGDGRIDMPELGIAIPMLLPLRGLAVALEAVVGLAQRLRHLLVACRQPLPCQGRRQGAGTLAGPA